jgi:hypothetical protein
MDWLNPLKDELAFLKKQLPKLEERPRLVQLANDFRKRIAALEKRIGQTEKANETDRSHEGFPH